MSSADICILTASANITRDVYQRFIDPDIAPKRMLRLGTFASLGIGKLTFSVLAWRKQDDVVQTA